MDYIDRRFERPRNWIKNAFEDGKTIDFIKNRDEQWLNQRVDEDGWPSNPTSYWNELVDQVNQWHSKKIAVRELAIKSTIRDEGQINDLDIPSEDDSCWQLYRKTIEHYDNIENIEEECINVLDMLSSDTSERDPVKGLVVGYVQSGKTANMTGLISMAADYGWNVFIVLSGTIDSLRVQNQGRLYNDLSHEGGRCHWVTLEHVNPDNPDQQPSRFDFRPGSPNRYLTVCLKIKSRLTNLLRWLNADQSKKKQMRILLIDDEADQASINTARPGAKRNAINDLIIRMVQGLDEEGNEAGPYAAMNYVSYTATPYANFLSEGSPKSLYPRNFVSLLTPSSHYIGPVKIYGSPEGDEDGLGIIGYPDISSEYGIIDVSEDVDYAISEYCDGKLPTIPQSLKDSLCWFLCSAAVLRRKGYRKPVSMLIHTSQVTDDHKVVAEAVSDYLKNDENTIIDDCRAIYSIKTSQLPKDFYIESTLFEGDPSNIDDYPAFESLIDFIKDYLKNEVKHIKMDKANKKKKYGNGIHLCIDNCKNDALDALTDPDDDEKLIPRLIYPEDKELSELEPAPAFIVVGGNTLSRGLTIKGLVCTYFARRVSQGDTLMQMGRWFGHRIGYELLPRIWMSSDSYDSFIRLIEADEALRKFIRENYDMYTPEQFPALVQTFPKTGYLLRMTASNKSRGAVPTHYNFEGTIIETSTLSIKTSDLENNLKITFDFIKSLKMEKSKVNEYDYVSLGVEKDRIFEQLLSKFIFSKKSKHFNEIEEIQKWVSKKCNRKWNVILAGTADDSLGKWFDGTFEMNKVGRSAIQITNDGESVFANIKSLSSPVDRYADIDPDYLDKNEKDNYETMKHNPSDNWRSIRNHCGLTGVPALLIYCISKESPASGKKRYPINSELDIIGLSIIMPGNENRKTQADYLQIPVSDVRGE